MQNYGGALKHVPPNLRDDRDLCLAACLNSNHALRYVPKHILDVEMCVRSLENSSVKIIDRVLRYDIPYDLVSEVRAALSKEVGAEPDTDERAFSC